MIWLTWRQFRAQAIAAAAVLAVLAIALASTRSQLGNLYHASGLLTCHGQGDCARLADLFLRSLRAKTILEILDVGGIVIMYLVPALLGLFWGAPLISRELETGTFRLAWNQSVTRTRWLTVKLGLLGTAAMAFAGLLSLMLTWWGRPIERVAPFSNQGTMTNRLLPLLFAAHGITPVGYAAFAFALGATVGVVIRRTVPAMAMTLAIFAFVQIAMPLWIRPHLISPVHNTTALTASTINGLQIGGSGGQVTVFGNGGSPTSWVLSDQTIIASGHPFTGPAPTACGPSQGIQACQNALGQLHLRELLVYQPASRYWALQWYETGIFLVLAALLTGACFWWTRHRLS